MEERQLVERSVTLEWKWYRAGINTTGKENRKWKKEKGEREIGKGYGTRDMGIWDMVCRKGHVGTWEGITYQVNE